ncbi:hypothetical protein WMY93_011789 [Mugilogobius chulae]|uniref:BOS complex subunit NCLN n=1 Tax=Mugilogobius chulae TaxID=88201 RepID=A0AAW0PFR8_9GOBI
MRLPVLLLLISAALLDGSALPAVSSYEFTAFRMQQFNLGQNKHGCRGAMVVAESRAAEDPALSRRCVLMKVSDFTPTTPGSSEQKAAAVLVLLPRNMSLLGQEERRTFMETEALVLRQDLLMPLYVAPEDDQLLFMYQELQQTVASRSSSIFSRVLRSMVTSTGFQILVINNSPIKPTTDTTVSGVLEGSGEDLPTIVVTAHYDSFGLAPFVSFGADSNGSGVVLLLELIRLFNKLYQSQRTRPKFNLLFSLTGAGKYNFIGTKRWLEENLDHAEWSLLQDNVAFVLCLDTLGSGDELFVHVSKRPAPESPLAGFTAVLEEVLSSRFPAVKLSLVHKKINLGESSVSWEHERFSLRRISALTLSRLQTHKSETRGSVLDVRCFVDDQRLRRNSVIVAEALGRFMFNLSHLVRKITLFSLNVFVFTLKFVCLFVCLFVCSGLSQRLAAVQRKTGGPGDPDLGLSLGLGLGPRATQLQNQDPDQVLVLDSLEQEFRQNLNKVQRYNFRMDKREPEVTFFDQMKQTIVMYRVKPAAFDLFLGGCIAVYLGLVYSAVQSFDSFFLKLKAAVKVKNKSQ